MNKKITGLIVFFTIAMSSVALANTYQLELNASHSSVEARFDIVQNLDAGLLITGIGGVYNDNDDDYKIADVKVAMGNEMLIPGLNCALGFKGLLGEVEFDNIDGDLVAIGFLLSAIYDIPKTVATIPLQILSEVTAAPGPLCFIDSDKYVEIKAGLGIHILENAAIIVGYRHIDIHFDKELANRKMSDDIISVGYRLSF